MISICLKIDFSYKPNVAMDHITMERAFSPKKKLKLKKKTSLLTQSLDLDNNY